MQHFMRHPWPGNVRQLRNLLFSMVVMARGDVLTLADLPVDHQEGAPPSTVAPPETPMQELEAIERTHILSTLEAHGGNRTHAAAALKISVRTLQRKLKAWGLENYLHRDTTPEPLPTS
jgi:DNA-binding NtrC family response regulator